MAAKKTIPVADLIDTTEAAAILGVSRRRVQALVTARRLSVARVVGGGRVSLLSRAAVESFERRAGGRPKAK